MQLATIFSPYSRRTAEPSKLDPCCSTYDRLQNQHFALGDHHDGARLWRRSILSQSCRHWTHFEDYRCVPFMSHVTLGDHRVIFSLIHVRLMLTMQMECSQYRGSTVGFNTCLNLLNPQFVRSTNLKALKLHCRFGMRPPLKSPTRDQPHQTPPLDRLQRLDSAQRDHLPGEFLALIHKYF